MTRYVVMIAVALMFALPVAPSRAADRQDDVVPAETPPRTQDKQKEDACGCCQDCRAAKSAIKPQDKEGANPGDGCKDCCDKCGQPLKSAPEETTPEVEKKMPEKKQ